MKSPSIFILILLVVVAGCSNDFVAPPDRYTLGEPIPIRYNEQVVIPDAGFGLWFRVVQDGRCPQGVECIVVNPANVRLDVLWGDTGGGPLDLEIYGVEGGSTATFHEYAIQLTKLTPYPTVDHMPIATEYVATIVVTRP